MREFVGRKQRILFVFDDFTFGPSDATFNLQGPWIHFSNDRNTFEFPEYKLLFKLDIFSILFFPK
jgi:hypothetical protein